jgi:peroxiredoxin
MEIPGFINLYKKYKNKGFEIIGISVDKGGKNDVIPFAKEYKINYPLVIGDSREIMKVFGSIIGIPTTFLIDRDGVIKNKYIGAQPESTFEKDIKKLLEK